MLDLMDFNMLAVVSARVVKPAAAQTAGADPVMIFGFFSAFCTIIVLMYQHKMQSRVPLLVLCLVMLSIYGFLAGTWSLGFSLAALSVSEFGRWYTKRPSRQNKSLESCHHRASLYEPETRVARMFGSL